MRILAISGSIRATSTIGTLLRAIVRVAPQHITWTIYGGLGDLPHFVPDLDGDEPPAAVAELRRQLRDADAVLVCTPEYAFSMPGALKNLFEWTVSSGEFVGKPVAAVSASPYPTGGERALASLLVVLTAVNAVVPEDGSLSIPLVRTKLDDAGALTDDATIQQARSVLSTLARATTDK